MFSVKPEVSVILPFYNACTTLSRAIGSIAAQGLRSFECILINNNSSDGSVDIAREQCNKDSRFRLIHEERQGVMFASNAGSENARGRYITRMDADDRAYPNRLQLQVEFLDANPDYGAVAGLVKHISHSEYTKGFARYVGWVNSVRSYQEILNSQFIESPVVNPSAMWRREIAEEHGMYKSGDFPEDYEMWLRWLSKGVKIRKLDETILDWHDSDTRLTRCDSIYSDASFYRIKSKYLAAWLEKNNPFHPRIAVWGASRISRRRARLLRQYGVEIECFIDIRRNRQLDQELVYYKDIPAPGKMFILTYIKQMNARDEIQVFLHDRAYQEGKNYLLIS
ncbi:MAG: glycosyltransferase family 2 protein [Bacteroidetes bacterium]|jgi:glycosyltransferase involved in cell wall biosynthesis|nr:glycosyltransferase family 2 protein [Bacteroidota bacterium]MBT4400936.1 glycosyltransferase family 2 protein [Bacteroidota bacterium]MBT5425764.1 glycosyltransferase family 2 protein [Bacteroidota bacterium]MBT7464276.1 glycosyltransferase family 2 protein [Bacteroidota bacterium]